MNINEFGYIGIGLQTSTVIEAEDEAVFSQLANIPTCWHKRSTRQGLNYCVWQLWFSLPPAIPSVVPRR